MFELFRSISESFDHPQRAHAALVHTPIALAMLGLIPLFIVVLTRGKSERWRWLCVAVYVLASATAFVASGSGERALNELDTGTFTEQAAELTEKHEEMGELVFWFSAATAAAVAISGVRHKATRVIALIIAVGLGVFTSGWVAATSHYGGQLVYVHGVGAPSTSNNIVVEQEAPPPDPAEMDEELEPPAPSIVESEHVPTATAPTTIPALESPATQVVE
jgi:uncharacterized membrane protein